MGTPIEGGEVQGGEIPDQGIANAPGPNPAWNDVLGVIPEQFHSVITPHFQKWDQSAQQRVEAANAKVSEYEPYNAFIEHGIDPTELENGLRLLYEVQTDPRKVYDALGKAYSLAEQAEIAQQAETPNSGEGQQEFRDPRYDKLEQGMEVVSKIILEDKQRALQAEVEAELDAELSAVKQAHPDADERFILAMMQNGMSVEDAGNAWVQTRNSLLQNNPRPFAPSVMGSSGGGSGYPSQQIDPTKLSGKDTRNLVAQMLAAEFGQKP